MPLNPYHADHLKLTLPEVQELAGRLSLDEIMALDDGLKRAEILQYLYDTEARCAIRSTGKEDIPFTMEGERRMPPRSFVIPGGKQRPRVFPLRVAVYVAASRDRAEFGGQGMTGGEMQMDNDRLTPVRIIPARPGLLEFTLLRDGAELDEALAPALAIASR